MEDQAVKEAKSEEQGVDFTTNKIVWVVGAIILLVIGWFGLQAIIGPVDNYKVTLIDAPKEVVAKGIATFTWRIDGPPTQIHSTAVRMGTTSNSGDLGREVKPADTKYTDFVKDFANGDFSIPLQFIGNTPVTTVGTYYFRVHATIKDKQYWSDEYTFEVKEPLPEPTQTSTGSATPTKGAAATVTPKVTVTPKATETPEVTPTE
jgi:hypothetical protein